MHTLFISLPMHGKTKKEIEQRLLDISRVAIHLACEKFGWDEKEVWWISSVDDQIDKHSEVKDERLLYLGGAIKLLANVDAVYFDEGWDQSEGCRIEFCVCQGYCIPFVLFDDLLKLNIGGKKNEEKEE